MPTDDRDSNHWRKAVDEILMYLCQRRSYFNLRKRAAHLKEADVMLDEVRRIRKKHEDEDGR